MAQPKKTKTIPIIVPRYVSEFRCLGSECPDTCCANWGLPIDRETYSKYRRVVHPAIKPLLKAYLVQNKEQAPSFAQHARLNLRESDGHCPMHTDGKLCAIQQHLGEGTLSNTCFMYPRYVLQFGNRVEQSMTLSCPEAARLALTGKDSFDFVSGNLPVRVGSVAKLDAMNGFSVNSMDAVRTFSIQLFQTSDLNNVERLLALGWLCNQIDDIALRQAQIEVDPLLAEMTSMVETGQLNSLAKELNAQSSVGVTVFWMLFANQQSGKRPPQQQEIVDWVMQGLGISSSTATNLLEVENGYRRGLELLQSDELGLEQILQRYLLNDLLREAFPWGQKSAMLHYRRLLTRFGILRLMLSGVAAAKSSALDKETMVRITQVFCRLYQHNHDFAKTAESCLQNLEWNSLERLYTLLK